MAQDEKSQGHRSNSVSSQGNNECLDWNFMEINPTVVGIVPWLTRLVVQKSLKSMRLRG